MSIFNNLFLDRKTCSHFYLIMLMCFKAIYWLILIIFISIIWEHKDVYINLLDNKTLSKSQEFKNYDIYKDFFYFWLKQGGIFLFKIFTISLIIKIFKNIPIPGIWIKKWEDQNLIDSIFGRKLCNHFRYNQYLSLENFYYFHKISIFENKKFKNSINNTNLHEIFKRHDLNFKKDQNLSE